MVIAATVRKPVISFHFVLSLEKNPISYTSQKKIGTDGRLRDDRDAKPSQIPFVETNSRVSIAEYEARLGQKSRTYPVAVSKYHASPNGRERIAVIRSRSNHEPRPLARDGACLAAFSESAGERLPAAA